MIKFLTYLIILLFCQTTSFSNEKSEFFEIGQKKYAEKKFEEAKFNFQKDIVRNPKNTKSYLYLAKIFKELNDENEFEKNLNNVLLLEPKNEEALYLIILKKIDDADYEVANSKYELFKEECARLCSKKDELNQLLNKSKS